MHELTLAKAHTLTMSSREIAELVDSRHDNVKRTIEMLVAKIEAFLPERLHANLNPKKTILQPLSRGVDFVGQVIKPWHRTTRRQTVRTAKERTRQCATADLFETANSYFGLLRQASHSHHDRNELANLLRTRGHCIKADMTKTYRRHA